MCEAVVETGQVVHIRDARLDPVARFHPLVEIESGIVFYAGAPIRSADGQVLGVVGISDSQPRSFSEHDQQTLQDFADWVMDQIERRRAERERDVSRHRVEILMEDPSLMIVEIDQAGIVVYVNHSVESFAGYSASEIMGREFLSFVHPDHRLRLAEDLKTAVQGTFMENAATFLHKDGSIRSLEWSSCPVQVADGNVYTVSVCRDVTERLRVESEMAIAEKRYRQLFETSRDGIAILALDGPILEVNDALCEMLGHSKETLENMHFRRLLSAELRPDEIEKYNTELMTQGFTPELEGAMRCRDGSPIPVSVCSWLVTDDKDKPLARLVRTRDISEQKQLELARDQQHDQLEAKVAQRTRELEETLARLRRAERLASVGTLASGLAHQINNPIGSILNAAEYALLCEHDENVHTVWKAALLDSVEQSKRCGRIVRSMLQYSRGAPMERWVEDLDVVLQRALNATQAYAKENAAAIEVSRDGHPMPVVMNPIEMEQVLVNLINNAIESHASGAKIKLRLEVRGEQICVEVADDGRGVAPEDRSHIFDPFFSTRQQEGGSGLGLSVSVGIVNEFGGTMSVASQLGVGTTITILMPLADSDAVSR